MYAIGEAEVARSSLLEWEEGTTPVPASLLLQLERPEPELIVSPLSHVAACHAAGLRFAGLLVLAAVAAAVYKASIRPWVLPGNVDGVVRRQEAINASCRAHPGCMQFAAFSENCCPSDTGAMLRCCQAQDRARPMDRRVGANSEYLTSRPERLRAATASTPTKFTMFTPVVDHASPCIECHTGTATTSSSTSTTSSTTTTTSSTTTSTSTSTTGTAPLMTFYAYRAQSDDEYHLESFNAANLAGVLFYLHHEVVSYCPRNHNITRILRLLVTMKTTKEVFYSRPAAGAAFIGFQAINSCQCPTAMCGPSFALYGYAPGCQNVGPRSATARFQYMNSTWYSFPGACISQKCEDQVPACQQNEPGGQCEVPTGTKHCTWNVKRAGEISLRELVNISNLTSFCEAGKKEYVKELDRGVGTHFWDEAGNAFRNKQRVQAAEDLFKRKYPASTIYADPLCD